MRIGVVTIFPEVMDGILAMGMLGVAQKKGLVTYRTVSPREFTSDVHQSVDDEPYGGGAGMVMMAPPIVEAVESLSPPPGSPVVLLSPGGKRFDQAEAVRLAGCEDLTFICGRYKGVDERVRDLVVTEDLSIGDYVLSGGELAAGVVIEAVVRLRDEVLGDRESGDTDSFAEGREGLLDCAWYTRPHDYRGLKVPETLLSGHHAEIEKWRRRSSLERTRRQRPDLLEGSDEDNES
jgi:tRNA (guanine37-N1)-methyltransferase